MLKKDAEITDLGRVCERETSRQLWGVEVDIVAYNKVKHYL